MNTKLTVWLLSGAAALLAASFTYVALSGSARSVQTSASQSIDRGRYIVHDLALCIDCHSPRGEDGRFVSESHLLGSPLPFVPTVEMLWTDVAPPIAGLPGYTREQAVRFLMTGERPTKTPVLPPMPPFRMNRGDAEAVADYLLSLRRS